MSHVHTWVCTVVLVVLAFSTLVHLYTRYALRKVGRALRQSEAMLSEAHAQVQEWAGRAQGLLNDVNAAGVLEQVAAARERKIWKKGLPPVDPKARS